MLGIADDAVLAVEVELVPAAVLAEGDLRRHAAGRGLVEVAHAFAAGAADVPAVERVARASRHAPSAGRGGCSPARSSSPRIAMMPPARCTSSMCTSALAGATLHSTGTRRDSRSMSSMVKSTLAFMGGGEQVQHGVGRAAHGDVERHGVLEGALKLAMVRGSDAGVVLLVVAPGQVDDQVAGLDEQALAVGVGGERRAVARQRQAERLGQAVHRVGGEHARARAAGRAGRALDDLRPPRR